MIKKFRIRCVMYVLICIMLCAFSYVFGLFRLGGITPQYVLCGVVAVAMFEGEKTGAVFGLIFGLLADFSSASLFGVNALVYMICGYVTGCIVSKLVTVNFLSCCLLTAGIIFTVDLVTIIIGSIIYNNTDFWAVLTGVTLFKELLTLPVSIGVFFLMRAVFRCPRWRSFQ